MTREDHSETNSLFGLSMPKKRASSILIPLHLSLREKLEMLKEHFENTLRMTLAFK